MKEKTIENVKYRRINNKYMSIQTPYSDVLYFAPVEDLLEFIVNSTIEGGL